MINTSLYYIVTQNIFVKIFLFHITLHFLCPVYTMYIFVLVLHNGGNGTLSTYRGRVEIWVMCRLSWIVHHNFVRDGK
jgi:hypothetical protein